MHPETNLSAEQVLGTLRRRAPVIALCVLVVAGTAFAFSKQQTKMYTATTALLFNNPAISQQVAGLPAISSGNNQQSQQDTNLQLVRLGDMAAKTAAALDHGLTKVQVARSLTVSAVGDTNLVNVSAVSKNPTLAAQIANTYSNEFVIEQQTSNQQYYANALALVTKQLAALSPTAKLGGAGLALQDRAQSLGTLAELRSSTVQIAQTAAVPASPSSPRTVRSTALAAVLGLLVGLGFAFLFERADRVIREPSDLAEVYHLPLLAAIPETTGLARSLSGGADSDGVLLSADAETFHLLLAHLRYFNVDRELKTLLVVSASAGAGKTTISCHLAAAAARLGSRALLIEADVRRPTISARLRFASGPGLSEVLIGVVPASEAIRTVTVGSPANAGAPTRTVDVLSAGAAIPPNPAELLASQAMTTLLEQAKAAYDIVVIDTPPIGSVADVFPLLRKVDGVMVVGRTGRDRRDLAMRTHETLEGVGAPLLGVIANGVKRSGRDSYYGYGYATYDAQVQSEAPGHPRGDQPISGRRSSP